ncbi:UNVERIFIED_CONTAM: hypothetical protein FKN15_022378 [Acipenser sinensis]
MFVKTVALLGLALAVSAIPLEDPEKGKNWVVIVAGSNSWYNYRHQADACHAYQIVHKNGIPDEQIVVMMYDDLAQNEENPTKGIVINRPNGTDVYKGVVKDYIGELHVKDLNKTITNMYKNNKYKKTLAHMKVMQFQGNSHENSQPAAPISLPPIEDPDLVPSPDVPLAILKRKLMSTNDISTAKRYLEEINSHLKVRELLKETMRRIVSVVTESRERTEQALADRLELTTQHDCYQAAVEHYKTRCFNWHSPMYEYALRQLYALVNLCEGGFPVNR